MSSTGNGVEFLDIDFNEVHVQDFLAPLPVESRAMLQMLYNMNITLGKIREEMNKHNQYLEIMLEIKIEDGESID